MSKQKVVIIGSGPAGLLACHAAVLNDLQPVMYSPDVSPPRLHGAQYLHSYIPDLPGFTPFLIKYSYYGDREGYSKKIYGTTDVNCSWGKFGFEVIAWDLGRIADELWSRYRMLIKERTVQPNELGLLVEQNEYVINTAPLDVIAPMGEFEVEYVWVAAADNHRMGPNEIHYYGDDRPEYRRSYIMGKGQVEYPDGPTGPVEGAVRIPKPLRARAHTPGVYRLGRYGQWKKGILVDQVFKEAMLIFQGKVSWSTTHLS